MLKLLVTKAFNEFELNHKTRSKDSFMLDLGLFRLVGKRHVSLSPCYHLTQHHLAQLLLSRARWASLESLWWTVHFATLHKNRALLMHLSVSQKKGSEWELRWTTHLALPTKRWVGVRRTERREKSDMALMCKVNGNSRYLLALCNNSQTEIFDKKQKFAWPEAILKLLSP